MVMLFIHSHNRLYLRYVVAIARLRAKFFPLLVVLALSVTGCSVPFLGPATEHVSINNSGVAKLSVADNCPQKSVHFCTISLTMYANAHKPIYWSIMVTNPIPLTIVPSSGQAISGESVTVRVTWQNIPSCPIQYSVYVSFFPKYVPMLGQNCPVSAPQT